jgi:hypothetical protein
LFLSQTTFQLSDPNYLCLFTVVEKMEKTKKEKPGFPIGLVALFTILTTGIIAEKNIHLEGSRPENKTENLIEKSQGNKINSRLWQDPFESVNYYLKNKSNPIQKINKKSTEDYTLSYAPSKNSPNLSTKLNKKSTEDIIISKTDLDEEKNDLIKLIEEINSWSAKDKKVTVLGVMVPSEFYFQDIEHRQRTRYAVLSGLGVKGIEPEDSNHIRLIKNIYNWPQFVPYEIFNSNEKGENKKVLVFWLLDSFFNDSKNGKKIPISRLLGWINEFNPKAKQIKKPKSKGKLKCVDGFDSIVSVKDEEKDERVEYIEKYRCEFEKTKNWYFKLIGPSSSGILRAMVEEAIDMKRVDIDPLFNWPSSTIEIFNVRATIDENNFLYKKDGSGRIYKNFQKIFDDNNIPIKFIRTVPTDGDLAKLIIKELGRRSIGNNKEFKNKCSGENRVALISEWDTAYGRSFQKTMYKNKNGADLCFQHFSYQRGIDGQIPGVKKDSKTNSELKNQNQNSNNAELQNQFDYLIRLSDQIKNQSLDGEYYGNSGSFKAFGILGSDFYDKLSVLKTLRKRFPGRVFFTTDLDARYFHRHEFPTVRNLLVASGYDLKLNYLWQKDIPPFRDSYQTSTFLAVQLALMSDSNKFFRSIKQDEIDSVIKPQVFEIGRNQAFSLIKNDWLESDWVEWGKSLIWRGENKTLKKIINKTLEALLKVDTDETFKTLKVRMLEFQLALNDVHIRKKIKLEANNLQSELEKVKLSAKLNAKNQTFIGLLEDPFKWIKNDELINNIHSYQKMLERSNENQSLKIRLNFFHKLLHENEFLDEIDDFQKELEKEDPEKKIKKKIRDLQKILKNGFANPDTSETLKKSINEFQKQLKKVDLDETFEKLIKRVRDFQRFLKNVDIGEQIRSETKNLQLELKKVDLTTHIKGKPQEFIGLLERRFEGVINKKLIDSIHSFQQVLEPYNEYGNLKIRLKKLQKILNENKFKKDIDHFQKELEQENPEENLKKNIEKFQKLLVRGEFIYVNPDIPKPDMMIVKWLRFLFFAIVSIIWCSWIAFNWNKVSRIWLVKIARALKRNLLIIVNWSYIVYVFAYLMIIGNFPLRILIFTSILMFFCILMVLTFLLFLDLIEKLYEKFFGENLERQFLLIPLFLSLILTALIIYDIRINVNGEIFAWFEGVSIWPSFILRWIALCLSMFLLFRAYDIFNKNRAQVFKNFFPDDKIKLLRKEIAIDDETQVIFKGQNKERIQAYLRLRKKPYQVNVFSLAIIMIFISVLASWVFGFPVVPNRGDLSFYCLVIVSIGMAISFYCLLFFVGEELRGTSHFIKNVQKFDFKWSSAVFNNFSLPFLNHKNPTTSKRINYVISQWLKIRLVEKQTAWWGDMIQYPYIVLFFIILARLPVFDNFSMTIPIFLILVTSALYPVVWALRIQFLATDLKENILVDIENIQSGMELRGVESNLIESVDNIKEKIRSIDRGAFRPLLEQPIFRALLAPFSGLGVVSLIEYLYIL